jgi:pimeloyl-ACP methyl ester carboxylesterase
MDRAAGVEKWAGAPLFIAGSENTIIGPEYQRTEMDRFPGSQLVAIDGAGHTMIGEEPARTVRAIREYLEAGPTA